MRTRKFLFNTLATALLQIITMLTGFILPKVMLVYFGSEINGLVTSISQLIAYVTLVEAGLSGAIVYSLYKPLADKDESRINGILVAAKNFYNKTAYLFLSISVLLAFVYPIFIKSQIVKNYEVTFLFLILSVNGVLEFFTLAKYRTLLTADQKTYVISLASIVQVIINVGIVTILSFMGASIVITRFVAILAILIRTAILWIYCKRRYKYLDFSVKPDNSVINKRWDALYMQVIGVVHNGAPVLIATMLLTLEDVSIYAIYYVVISGINAILSIFMSGLSAGFGDLLVRNEKERFEMAFTQFEYLYYILITIVYSVMMILYTPFIKIYTFNADINYVYPIFAVIMTTNGYFYNLKTPFGMLTISAGKYRESRIQITIQGSIAIILGIILGVKWGIYGIILGSLVSNIYRDIDFVFFAPKHLTKYSFRKSLWMWIRSISIVAFITISGLIIPQNDIKTYGEWLKYAVLIGIFSTVFTLIINIFTDYALFKSVQERIKLLMPKKKYN